MNRILFSLTNKLDCSTMNEFEFATSLVKTYCLIDPKYRNDEQIIEDIVVILRDCKDSAIDILNQDDAKEKDDHYYCSGGYNIVKDELYNLITQDIFTILVGLKVYPTIWYGRLLYH